MLVDKSGLIHDCCTLKECTFILRSNASSIVYVIEDSKWAKLHDEKFSSVNWRGFLAPTKPLVGGSVDEWLACWTQAQKDPGSNRSRDAVG